MRLRLAREDAANDCGVSCADEDAKAKDSTPAFCCSGCCVRAMCGVVRPWSEDARHEQKGGDGLQLVGPHVACGDGWCGTEADVGSCAALQ